MAGFLDGLGGAITSALPDLLSGLGNIGLGALAKEVGLGPVGGSISGSPLPPINGGGMPINAQLAGFPQILGGAAAGGLGAFLGGADLPMIDVLPQGSSALTSPFSRTASGARAQAHVQANPATGRLTWFKPAGRPVLFSGDLTACRQVNKLARRARRAQGGRR